MPSMRSRNLLPILEPSSLSALVSGSDQLQPKPVRDRLPRSDVPSPKATVLITRATSLEFETGQRRQDRESANAVSLSRARVGLDTSRNSLLRPDQLRPKSARDRLPRSRATSLAAAHLLPCGNRVSPRERSLLSSETVRVDVHNSDFWALSQQSLPCLPWVYTSNRPDALMEAQTPRKN